MKNKQIINGCRGQFFSIGIFVLIVILLLVFTYAANFNKENDEFQIHRLRIEVMNSFVDEFESTYAGTLIEASLKPSVAAYLDQSSNSLSFQDLVTIMKTGKLGATTYTELDGVNTNNTLKSILSTLTVGTNVESNFNYEITSAEMISPSLMRITFKVSYAFNVENDVWAKENIRIVKILSIYDLKHPTYRVQIEDNWIRDESTCFATQLFSQGTSCSNNLLPPLPVPPPIP